MLCTICLVVHVGALEQRSEAARSSLPAAASGPDVLANLFREWRGFVAPPMNDGVPDYTPRAMTAQYGQLSVWRDRLRNIDTSGWSIADRVDWTLVWAEMNGFEFEHRVTRPWERDPAFYVWFHPDPTDVPEREGPTIHGAVELPRFAWPLSKADAQEITRRLDVVPRLLTQARTNLTGNAQDLWKTGIRSIREQSDALRSFSKSVRGTHAALAATAERAAKASDAFAVWLEEQLPQKTGPSGIGKDKYSWYMRYVHLAPFDYDDVILLLRRELDRSHASLRLEEERNRALPPHRKIASAEKYDRRLNDAVTEYMAFLRDREVLTIRPYMDPALRERIGRFTPSDGLRGFFAEITYREPLMMRTHDFHWIDLARLREEPHPSLIRRTPLLYNIFDSRAEGLATGMEEMMMHAGLFDAKPRARELVWILIAQRAARGLAGVYQHGLEMTFVEATAFASRWTPWNLLPADGSTIQHEEQFYLQQPGYEASYLTGKMQIERLIADFARTREGSFRLREFMDTFTTLGVIPVSLLAWEMTGDPSMLLEAIGPH